jgi:hypothetical protein
LHAVSTQTLGSKIVSPHSQDIIKLFFTKLRREIGPSALAANLIGALAAAASLDFVLEEESFRAEPVAAVQTTEEEVFDVPAPALVDGLEAFTVLLADNFKLLTVTALMSMSPPRYCPPLFRVLKPEKLTLCYLFVWQTCLAFRKLQKGNVEYCALMESCSSKFHDIPYVVCTYLLHLP